MAEERFKARFDGVTAFAELPPDVQTAIGGIALELVVAWNGEDAYVDPADPHATFRAIRPYEAASQLLLDKFHVAVSDAIPEPIEAKHIPVPSVLGQVCRRCGCSEEDACVADDVACHWVESDLCSACANRKDRGA